MFSAFEMCDIGEVGGCPYGKGAGVISSSRLWALVEEKSVDVGLVVVRRRREGSSEVFEVMWASAMLVTVEPLRDVVAVLLLMYGQPRSDRVEDNGKEGENIPITTNKRSTSSLTILPDTPIKILHSLPHQIEMTRNTTAPTRRASPTTSLPLLPTQRQTRPNLSRTKLNQPLPIQIYTLIIKPKVSKHQSTQRNTCPSLVL